MICKYVNSAGKEISFLSNNLKATNGFLHGRKYTADVTDRIIGEKVNRLTRDSVTYQLTITVRGTAPERKAVLNSLHDIVDYDCITGAPGTLYYGDWKAECFIMESSPSGFGDLPSRFETSMNVYVPGATWWKETLYQIMPSTGGGSDVVYPTMYPFTYPLSGITTVINNDHYIPCDYLMRVYGPAAAVDITIAGHEYKVDYSLEAGEYMVIDSRDTKEPDERCYVVHADGTKENAYNFRGSDLFTKIPTGSFELICDRTYGIDFVLLRGRSEPEWQ